MKDILFEFGLSIDRLNVQPLGNGLINLTWKVESRAADGQKYILQRVNKNIFKKPEDIAYNIRLIDSYLEKFFPGYLFTSPRKSIWDSDFVKSRDSYFRMFSFIENSHTIDVVTNPAQAYEAAKQFGAFTKKLSGFSANDLKITLPDFSSMP